ncbi:hypothetical protein HELRODRAFT_166182 [Helobdella robusta]|uniref:BAH domain-containing protein n=1 Tax=Helobdella robusta TaxID=6412 RepID=T1EXV7_HELRO|nr:hypothetical protein HELRODRAFT_166182 [Helobdella robusta]ESN90511.1 hypothetical protein HELRODRAFT_166182 [Helobdella robusta]
MFGHYFLRPSEVFRDAGQKFFEREVLKATTLSCCVQLDRVVARCIVMDVNSYLLGRPTGFDEEDVYVCEFRVNKAFRTQKKPLKFVNPVNKSSYCFQYFKKDAVTFKRNYMPNGTISSGEHRHHYKRGRSQRNSKLKNAAAQVLVHLDESHSNLECVGDNSNVERPGDNEDESGKKHVSKNVIQTRKVEEKKANLEDLIKKLKYS